MSKDYYKILGVAEFDSAEEIKKAYRKLARKFHPDIAGNSNDAISRFKEINEAYAILSNKIKKEEYDRARRFYNYAKKEAEFPKEPFKETTNSSKFNMNFNFSDFFTKNDKNFEKQPKAPKQGENIYSEIEISTMDAMLGVVKTINVLQTTICPKCNGHKFVNGNKCSHCGGKGELSNYSKLSVRIPAGIKNKSKIRLAGAGEAGKNGGSHGDLYLTINIVEPQEYKANGLNIHKTIAITPFEAVLGAEIKVLTLDGEIRFTIPPRTQSGQKFSLSKCGAVQNEKIGDMIITVEIKIPNNLSDEEITLYEKLKEISTSNIRETDYDR